MHKHHEKKKLIVPMNYVHKNSLTSVETFTKIKYSFLFLDLTQRHIMVFDNIENIPLQNYRYPSQLRPIITQYIDNAEYDRAKFYVWRYGQTVYLFPKSVPQSRRQFLNTHLINKRYNKLN